MRHENESWRNASTQQKAREVAKSEVKTHWSEANEHFIDKNEKKKKMRKDDELKSKHNNTQNEDVFFYTNGCFGFFFSLLLYTFDFTCYFDACSSRL